MNNNGMNYSFAKRVVLEAWNILYHCSIALLSKEVLIELKRFKDNFFLSKLIPKKKTEESVSYQISTNWLS